jgi:O-antigen/teichoic acid export membrane protein
VAQVLIRFLKQRGGFLRMLGGSVAVQAVLSASNFAVGLMLVRRTADAQYGYYVLVTTAILLMTTMQGAYIFPPMVNRLTRADRQGRADLIGSLYRDQRRLIPLASIFTALFALFLYWRGQLTLQVAAIIAAATLAIIATLRREFMRLVLLANRRPNDVLYSDFFFCVLLIIGAAIATASPWPAAAAAFTLSLAALAGGTILAHRVWKFEPWNKHAAPGMLWAIAPEGGWSSFGGVVHWIFSQGYNYVVAGFIDVSAVAALAATRLLIMPVTLLSTGVGSMMLPTASKWQTEHRAAKVLRRLLAFSVGMVVAAGFYMVIMWLARNWIFEVILHKHFAHRDLLLGLWCSVALVTTFRDQFLYFLVTRSRFRSTSWLTVASAIAALTVSLISLRVVGATGALYGLLTGELVNVGGIVWLSIREVRQSPDPLPGAEPSAQAA